MKRILGLIAALALLQVSAPALADPPVYAKTVSACGTPGSSPVVGNPQPATIDQTGVLCTSSTGGGGTSTVKATAAPPTYVEGSTNNPVSSDLAGNQRVISPSNGVTGSAVKTTSDLAGISDGTNQQPILAAIALGDGVNGNNEVSVGNWYWNGATWDRMRGTTSGLTVGNIAGTITLPTGASTSALQGAQGTGATYNPPTGGSGEIGYLSGIYAAAVSTTPTNTNVAQVNGVTVDIGAGAPGTGTQRVSVATGSSIQPVAGTTGGADPVSKQVANNTTSVAICTAACTAYSVYVQNNSATIAYLKLYNAAQGSTTCGSGTPVDRIMIPASTSGAGAVIPLGAAGVAYGTALTSCVTTGFADADATAPAASAYQFTIYKK